MNDYLLDTHAFLWFLQKNKRIPPNAVDKIQDSQYQVYISIVSFWELSIKSSLGKLDLGESISDLIKRSEGLGFITLDIESSHLEKLASIPFKHKDPFDRLIIAQGITDDLIILSGDRYFKDYTEAQIEWE